MCIYFKHTHTAKKSGKILFAECILKAYSLRVCVCRKLLCVAEKRFLPSSHRMCLRKNQGMCVLGVNGAS